MTDTMANFTPKRTLMDWDLVARVNFDRLLKNESKLDEELESLYPLLVSAKITEGDPRATPEALLKLFRLSQYVMELKNMFLEGAETQIERIEETLKTQESEISKLKSRSGAAPSAELRMLRQENLDLERRNELLTRDLQRVEENYAKEVKFGQEVGAALSEEKARYATLSETTRELQNEMKEREVQMVSQRHRLLSKNIEEEEFRSQLKEKNMEVNKYLAEIKSLTTQNVQLSNEVDTIGQELDATVSEIERNAREIEEMQTIINSNDLLLDQVTEERDTLKIKVEEMSDKLQMKQQLPTRDFLCGEESQTDEAVESLHYDFEYLKKIAAEADANAVTYKNQVERLTQEVAILKKNAISANDDSLRTEIREKDETIESLRLKLAEAYKDFEVLSLDWDRIDSLVKDKAGGELEGLRSQAALATRLREKVKLFKDRHVADMEKVQLVQKQMEEKETELVDLRQRMDSYERGIFGLRESIREVKQLKLEKNIRDKEIATLAKKINDFEQQVSDFVEENEELRMRLGIKSGTKIDLSNVQSIKTVELEKAKGLNIALQKEIDTLEQERLKLKDALRLQALSRGERAVAMGLGVEELTAVEEYAAKLRGSDDTPFDIRSAKSSRPVLNNAQLEKLTIELERIHVEAAEARERCEIAERDMRRVQAENRALEAVVKEVSVTLIKTRGTGGSSSKSATTQKPGTAKDASSIRFPVIEKLLLALEKKKHKDLTSDLYGNESVEDHIMQVNQTLREELLAMRVQMEELERQVESSKQLAETSQKSAEALRMRAMKARGKVLELPTELLLGSVHDYSSVVEQLVECLMELQVKDKELRECRKSLEKFECHYAALAGKQRNLYRDYNLNKRNASQEITKLKDDLASAMNEREGAEIKIEELERLLKSIHDKCEWNHTQRSLVESQRAVAVLRVNEVTLKRKYLAAADAEQTTRKDNAKLKSDLMALDRVARETISRLNRSNAELCERIYNLTKVCEESIPKTDFNLLQNKSDLYIAKTKLLLEREQNWVSEREQRESDSRELVRANKTITNLEIALHEACQTVKIGEQSLQELEGIRNDIQGREQLAVLNAKVVKLEVAQDVMQKRAELAESKCASVEAHEQQLKQRLDSLEKSFLDASEANVKLKEAEIQLRNLLESAVTREEHELTAQELKMQKGIVSKLNSEVTKYKDLADISSNQTADLLHLRSQDEKEKAILRATIQELQMEGDEKLLIGKLHHHILALQMSESGAMRKLDVQQSKCLRLESRVVKLERAIDDRDSIIFQIKMDSRNSLRLLQKAVSEMRARLAGHVTLEKHERVCAVARHLDSRKLECEEKVKFFESQIRGFQDQVAERELSIQQLNELIDSLKPSANASERIISWQSRMATLQVANLRLLRDLDFQRQAKLGAEANLEEHMSRVNALEDQLVSAQIEADNRQLEWEKRQEDMETIVQQLETEREQIFHAASLADVSEMRGFVFVFGSVMSDPPGQQLKHSLPDRSLPVSHQLEAALRMLVERSRLLTAQEIKISGLEKRIAKLKEKLTHAGNKMAEKDSHITELRINVARNDLREGEGFTEYDNKTRMLVRKREGEAMKNAQEVINSLQRQLSKKEELVERYRDMITENRKEAAQQKEVEKAEISNLTEVINTLNDRQVNKLKNPHEEDELAALREKYAKVKEKFLALREESDTEIANLREELSIRNASHHEYETQIEALKRDLHMNEKELALAAEAADESIKSRGLQEQISKLEREIAKRDHKISNMGKAIHQLKETLIKTAEEAAEMKIRESHENLASSTDQRGIVSIKKVAQLEGKVEKMTQVIEAHKKAEKDLQTSITKLKSDLHKRDKEIEVLSDNLRDSQKLLRKQQKTLQEEEHNSHSRSGSTKRSMHDDKHGDADASRASDKERRLAKLLDEEKKRAADAAKERWDAEKKQQKRLTAMKAKLDENSLELSNCRDREKQLKDTIQRLTQENQRYQKKVSNLNSLPAAAAAALEAQHQQHRREQQQRYSDSTESMQSYRESDSSRPTTDRSSYTASSMESVYFPPDDPDLSAEEAAVRRRLLKSLNETDHLQKLVLKLEKEIYDIKQVAEVELPNEIDELKMKNKRLKEEAEKSREEDESRRTSKTMDADGEDDGSRSLYDSSDDERWKKSPKHVTSSGFDKNARRGEKSKHSIPMLESRIQDLLQRLQNLEDEKFSVDQKLLAAQFEKERASAHVESLERRVEELEETLKAHYEIADARKTKHASNEIPGLNVTYTQLRTATSRLLANKTKDELAAVIDHLSTAAEKLKLENDKLKRGGQSGSGISNLKFVEMTKEIKALRREKAEAVEMAKAKAVSDAQTQKVELENTKLRNFAQKDADKMKKLIQQIKSLEATNQNLSNEVASLRKQFGVKEDPTSLRGPHDDEDEDSSATDSRAQRMKYAEKIAHLKGQLAEKDEIIGTLTADGGDHNSTELRKLRRELEMWKAQCAQLKEQLAQRAERPGSGYRAYTRSEANTAEIQGGMGEVIVERNALRENEAALEREVSRLKAELNNFDSSFFEELEDLKNKYREAVKLNIKYEEHIRNLCNACGYNADRILSQPFRRQNSGGPSREHNSDY
ncbi:hypothetical protein HDU81_005450 [Chytriomyces hyalinus]|nr:hypothetical protein HDU81_005450 [Chytriomyces hyalinus]